MSGCMTKGEKDFEEGVELIFYWRQFICLECLLSQRNSKRQTSMWWFSVPFTPQESFLFPTETRLKKAPQRLQLFLTHKCVRKIKLTWGPDWLPSIVYPLISKFGGLTCLVLDLGNRWKQKKIINDNIVKKKKKKKKKKKRNCCRGSSPYHLHS